MITCFPFFKPRDILCGAADEVLATLKKDSVKEEQYHEICGLLGLTMEQEQFTELSDLGRKITDYGMDKQGLGGGRYRH